MKINNLITFDLTSIFVHGIIILLIDIRLISCCSFQQIRQMIADVDKDGSGAIDYDEFEYMMTAKIGERDTKEELMKAFHIIDHDNNVRS